MDNATFQCTEIIKQMCLTVGVKLVYLPPHCPDLNPIGEFFAELKAFIKRRWLSYTQIPNQGFNTILSMGEKKRRTGSFMTYRLEYWLEY